jgi:hypothetical protein
MACVPIRVQGRRAVAVLREASRPNRPLRTLEVYCGRAGWSANMKMRGDHAWFLDHDESKVRPSFATKEDELCINGLDEVLHMSVATIQRDPPRSPLQSPNAYSRGRMLDLESSLSAISSTLTLRTSRLRCSRAWSTSAISTHCTMA